MAVYVYAITDGVGDVSDVRGLHDEPLRTVTIGSFVVVVGHAVERVAATRELLATRDRIVRLLHARAHALLPVRFATTVPDVTALTRQITDKRAAVAAALRNVHGCDQMTLWLLKKASHATAAAPAAARGPGLDAACPEAQYLSGALRTLVRDERIEASTAAGVAAGLYHLIERSRATAYRRAVVEAAAGMPSVTIRVSGPSPAYAFTALN